MLGLRFTPYQWIEILQIQQSPKFLKLLLSILFQLRRDFAKVGASGLVFQGWRWMLVNADPRGKAAGVGRPDGAGGCGAAWPAAVATPAWEVEAVGWAKEGRGIQ